MGLDQSLIKDFLGLILEKFSRACWSFCAVEGAKHKFQGVQVKY
jgi:hypothetical protein